MSTLSVLEAGKQITIEQAIQQSASAFDTHELVYGHGTSDALSEAAWLISHALSLSPQDPPNYAHVLSDTEIEQCNLLVCRRIQERIPAAYITGIAWFAGLAFKSDERALVPRSPLAEFILDDFFDITDPSQVHSVLDLCTGGGCIGIACATQLPHAQVDASDLSEEALALAKDNVEWHELQGRVKLIHSALFDNITQRYDLIISNPPYVDARDISEMGQEFDHEPMMGLAAGEDGLDLVRHMLHQASEHLTENGILVVEVGNSAQALEDAYPEVPFLWLEFQDGGTGVFVLTRKELLETAECIKAGLR